jgi:glutaredoxin
VADRRGAQREHADGGLRARGAARRPGDGHPGPVPVAEPRVTIYHAQGCHLCERARAVVAAARADCAFELEEVDVTGDTGLEARYREWLPVVEIEGERAFVYYVDAGAFRRKVQAQTLDA